MDWLMYPAGDNPPSIEQIVEDWLRQNGFDGLACPELECGCRLGDLMPCEYPELRECVAGRIRRGASSEQDEH